MAEAIQSHVFDNGLVLVAEPMPWLESAAFTFLIPCGAVHDPEDRRGLSSFVCDMALRGAGDRDGRQFLNDLERLGASGSESVSDSVTSFSGRVLADRLHEALPIYADMLRRPHLPASQIEASRQTLQQELQALDDEPQQKIMAELKARHYAAPWGRPSQGDEAGLASISHEDLLHHWNRCYRPNGAILAVAGKFDFDALKGLVGELFGDWRSLKRKTPAERRGKQRVAHLHYDSKQTQIGVAFAGVPYRDPKYLCASAAVTALSGSMYSRLFVEIREKRGLCYTVYASQHSLLQTGSVLCYAGSTADRAQETLDLLLAELVRLSKGLAADEIERVKAHVKRQVVMAQESSASRSGSLARDWQHLGRARSLDEIHREFDKLTRRKINTFLSEHPPADFTVATLGPQPLEIREPLRLGGWDAAQALLDPSTVSKPKRTKADKTGAGGRK